MLHLNVSKGGANGATMKAGHTGVRRIVAAAGYSLAGLGFAWRREAAFRQGVLLAVVLVAAAGFAGFAPQTKLVLVVLALLVPFAEIVNSAIEALTDLVSPGPHELAKAAKDMGSAAVFIALAINVLAWYLAFVL